MALSVATVGLAIGRAVVGRRFASALHEMERAQYLPPEELQARNEERLVRLLRHAVQNVPFYRGVARPEDIRSRSDIERFPLLDKLAYRAQEAEQFCASDTPAWRRMERSTSGSTGKPFPFALDRQALPRIFASHLFYDSWFGLPPFSRYIRVVSPSPASPPPEADAPLRFRLRTAVTGRLQKLYENWTQERILVWDVDPERAVEIYRRIQAFRPDFVMGYTSTLATIADELLRRGLRLDFRLKAVATIAETLTPLRRRLIAEWFNAPIANRYGMREFGSWIAQSCLQSPDLFHVNTELAVCEVLRPDGSAAEPGETGRVVLTDLSNFARPFIRYETGDLAVAAAGRCACGRGFPLLGPIEGRSKECLVTPAGKVISPTVLGHYLFVYCGHMEAVLHYQLVQEAADRVTLLVVPCAGWNDQRHERMTQHLRGLLGTGMHAAVRTVSSIPLEKSGKRPIIKLAANVEAPSRAALG